MIRLFALGRGLPAFTREQYHLALLERHAPLVRSCSGFRRWCKHYHQNHMQGQLSRTAAALAVGPAQFDNCSEFWFDDVESIISTFNDPSYLEGVRPDEKNWTDPASRVAFVADEIADRHFNDAVAKIKLISLASTVRPGDNGDEFCARRSESVVLGVLDFPRSRLDQEAALPYQKVTERWFLSERALENWLDTRAANIGSTACTHLWAIEHTIF